MRPVFIFALLIACIHLPLHSASRPQNPSQCPGRVFTSLTPTLAPTEADLDAIANEFNSDVRNTGTLFLVQILGYALGTFAFISFGVPLMNSLIALSLLLAGLIFGIASFIYLISARVNKNFLDQMLAAKSDAEITHTYFQKTKRARIVLALITVFSVVVWSFGLISLAFQLSSI